MTIAIYQEVKDFLNQAPSAKEINKKFQEMLSKAIPDGSVEEYREAVSLLLGAGSKKIIDKYTLPNAATVYSLSEVLLNHPTNPIPLKEILNKASDIVDSPVDVEKNIIKLSLDNGIHINELSGAKRFHLETFIKYKDLLLNHPTHPMTDGQLLALAVRSSSIDWKNPKKNDDKYEFIKDLLENGADVNTELKSHKGTYSALRMAHNQKIIDLLKSHGATCGAEHERLVGLEKQENLTPYLEHPQDVALAWFNNLWAEAEYINKIPYIVHHVWFTHPSSPNEIKADDIENVIKTKEIFGDNVSKWSHVVWTNDKNLIPSSVKALEENGIEVRSMQDYKEEIRAFDLIQDLVDKKLWGMASDLMRYVALEKFGGIYSDLNFEFTRSIESDLHSYDFFSNDMVNYFFAAKANHPIITHLVDMVEQNLSNPPSYLASIEDGDVFTKTVYSTLVPFGASILKHSNQDGNIDTVFQYYNENTSYNPNYNMPNVTINMPDNSDYVATECKDYWKIVEFADNIQVPGGLNFSAGHDGHKSSFTWMED